MSRRRIGGRILGAWALVSTACATTAGVAQPQPFPTAPVSTPAPPRRTPAPPVTTPPKPDAPATTPPASPSTSAGSGAVASKSAPSSPASSTTLGPAASGPSSAELSKDAPAASKKVESVVKTALNLQGTRYRPGGETPSSGFDCSGFVRYVFERYQIEVPRTVAEQYQTGKKIAPSDIRKGDLLFFSTTGKGPTHVGIALGPASLGEFVHAPGSGGSVRVEHFDTSYWRSKLIGVRRVM